MPLRRALELLAAQTDARYEVVGSARLRVWFPEVLKPEGEDGFTAPVLVTRVELGYPEEARKARVASEVRLLAVIRWDGTVGNVVVVSGVAGWPAIDEAAIASVRARIYKPATKHGQLVSVYYAVRIAWQLR